MDRWPLSRIRGVVSVEPTGQHLRARMSVFEPLPQLAVLPEPPSHQIEVIEDRSSDGGGFLRRISRLLRVAGDQTERDFTYDEVDRRALDAVVIVPYYRAPSTTRESEIFVVLRSALRPPIALRSQARSPCPEPVNRSLWEFPAGLVEPDEISEAGLVLAAARELFEETGFRASPEALTLLGPSSFPCPGVISERHFFFKVVVDPKAREKPSLDGSPLESIGELVAVPLETALQAAREGRLADAKSELALRRLAEDVQ